MVRAASVPQPLSGRIELSVNGALRQGADLSDMTWDLPHVIAELSKYFELCPGDLIMTGTPAGVGMARDPKLYMKPGDVVEVEIEGIGTLRNPIEDEAA